MNRRSCFAAIVGIVAGLFLPKRAEAKLTSYKEDSNFLNGVRTDVESPINWYSKKFKYEWLELWSHSGTIKVGIADIQEPIYWRGIDYKISGPTVIMTGMGGDTPELAESWIRVLRKTSESVITPNTEK